jgi:hypothetical protein
MDGRSAHRNEANKLTGHRHQSGTVASLAERGRLHLEGASESLTPLRCQTGQKATGGHPANRQHRASHPQIAEARLRRSDLVENVISSEQLKSSLVRNFRQRGASNGASSVGRETCRTGGRRTWATLDNIRRRFFVGHPKAINRTEIA